MDKAILEERLIDFAVQIITVINELPNNKAGNHLGNQLIRSGTAPALNYGEAQSGESRKDFIHKMKIALKELRETLVNLKIIDRSKLLVSNDVLQNITKENNELISIFVRSVKTVERNQ